MILKRAVFCVFLCLPYVYSTDQKKKFEYDDTYKYDVTYEKELNRDVEYIMEFAGDKLSYDTPARVEVSSPLTNKTYPLFVTARQQKGVFSWQLPMVVQTPSGTITFTNISRTLCPHNNLFDEPDNVCAGPEDVPSRPVGGVTTPHTHVTPLTRTYIESPRLPHQPPPLSARSRSRSDSHPLSALDFDLGPSHASDPGSAFDFDSRTVLSADAAAGLLIWTKPVANAKINAPIVHLTTSSPTTIIVEIKVITVKDFYINMDNYTYVEVTPSRPQYYFYPFKQGPSGNAEIKYQMLMREKQCMLDAVRRGRTNKLLGDRSGANGKFGSDDALGANAFGFADKSNMNVYNFPSSMAMPKNVIIDIVSDNDVCAIVSIQNFSCPVFDNERDILYDGYYLTMTRRGGITVSQDLFNAGFYIVFIVKSSDEDCLGKELPENATESRLFLWKHSRDEYETNERRLKKFSFRITETISYSDYITGSIVILGFFLCFYIALILIIFFNGTRKFVRNSQPSTCNSGGTEESPLNGSDAGSSTPTDLLVRISVDESSGRQVTQTRAAARKGSSSSDSDSDHSNRCNDVAVTNKTLCVAHLAQKKQKVIENRSKMYLWNVLIVTVFYTLPVIQLVVTYQRMLNQSGNQDLCYFNFLCAHPLLMLSDFNHVYSNIGYVLLGMLFLIQVWRRHQMYRCKSPAQKELGLPQHFGLLYAMAIALVSEGLLSAAYHVCPNSMNFQFDTSFMYVTSVMCMIKIYQNRHPDINARAHATFGVLALIIFIGLVGVLNANIYFWIVFTILHLGTCLAMTLQIYYMGRFKLEGTLVSRAARQLMSHPIQAITPMYCGRMVLLVIANLANWAIATYGVIEHNTDFASHLLVILMSNLFLYTLFYIVMKLLNRERIVWYSWVYIALTYSFWFVSGYFYLDKATDWSKTPALSRSNNHFCTMLQLYDSHDIWHFLSAVAMFFSFNMYLTLDDNLSYRPRSEIMVF